MLTVHHLNQSRSHRVIWALEELALPYEIVHYQREKNMLAPEALKKVHPLGKSPVIEDNGLILAESGAILEYLQETYDAESRLKPLDPAHKVQYRFWLHYAEGSLMPLLLMKLVFSSLGKPPVPFGILRKSPSPKRFCSVVKAQWSVATHCSDPEARPAQRLS